MAPEISSKIDNRYDVLGELGRGGMGVVYKATDVKMDRLVAIKVMTAHAPGRGEYQERFLREARSIAKMQHPNIVVVHDFGYHAGAPYIAMEYVEGVPLDKVISSRVSLSTLTKVNYVVQVCQALHYAHQLGIVHRDVKPGNIMVLDAGRRVKLLDFGIARAGKPSDLSKTGSTMGTTCYMSPEQTRGQKDLDGRADIFSAGVVLYELLTGKQPWTGDSDYDVMDKIIHEPFPPLSGNYPAALALIFERALAKDKNARYETAEIMAHDLAELEVPLKEQALEEALVQFEHGDLLRANDLVSQILRIDTRHRQAVELRLKLQQVAQLQQRGEQVRQLRATAEVAVGQKRFTEALAAVEQAITIDAANTELFHYRELIRNEFKRREDIRKKLDLAERAREINDLSTAEELVDKVLEVDPTDTQARMMKSSLEQERKRQQVQEVADEASRALAIRAFPRVREFIQQLEALDPNCAPLSSLKKSLLEGEAEEQRRIEVENLVREIRRVLETGDVAQSLLATQQALARFPGELRLVRFRAQAETLRDAAERERAVQEQAALVQQLTEKGQNVKALAVAENAVKHLGADPRLQALVVQLGQVVEHERQVHAEQSILAQANNAVHEADFEFAIKILTAAQVDFPNSKAITDALQVAHGAKAENAEQEEAARRERKAQAEREVLARARSAVQAKDFGSAVKILAAAWANFPDSKEIAKALQAAQAASAQEAAAVKQQLQAQAEQAALAQARSAMQSGDFESALQILTAARIDSPNSKEIAEALQAAQAASARKAEENAAILRKREIVEALERTLANESDPDLQVRLAEEAVRRIPGNDAADRVLARVRDRQRQVASAIERARQFENTQRYGESIQEWQSVRKLWPQCPNLDEQIAGLKTAQQAPVVTPEPPSATPRFSATSIMAAAPATAPSSAPQAAPQPASKQQQRPASQAAAQTVTPTVHTPPLASTETKTEMDRRRPRLRMLDAVQPLLRSKKLPFAVAAAAVVVILIPVLYLAFRTSPKPAAKPLVIASHPITPAVPPTPLAPVMGKLTVRANVDQFDLYVDSTLQPTSQGREATIPVRVGSHTITVEKRGYAAATPQQVQISKDQVSALQFMLTKSQAPPEPEPTYLTITSTAGATVRINSKDVGTVQPEGSFSYKTTPGKLAIEVSRDGYKLWSKTVAGKSGDHISVNAELTAIPKPPPIIEFTANPNSVQQGASVQLQWDVKNASQVTLDHDIGPVGSKSSRSVNPTESVTYTLTAKGEGGVQTKAVPITVNALPKPAIKAFNVAPKKIHPGDTAGLLWTILNASEGFISSDGGSDIGKVEAQGSIEVNPTKTTTYTLTVKGAGGISDTKTAQVVVEPLPASASAASAPPPQPPAAATEDPEVQAINQTLEDYRAAYSSMSIERMRSVWPGISKEQQKALEGAFNSSEIKAITVGLHCGKPAITGETAQSNCKETLSYTVNGKVQQPHTSQVVIRLKKNSGKWQVMAIAGK